MEKNCLARQKTWAPGYLLRQIIRSIHLLASIVISKLININHPETEFYSFCLTPFTAKL